MRLRTRNVRFDGRLLNKYSYGKGMINRLPLMKKEISFVSGIDFFFIDMFLYSRLAVEERRGMVRRG